MRHVVMLILLSLLSLGCSQPSPEPTAQPEPIIAERDPDPTPPEPMPPEPAQQPVSQQPPRPFIPHDESDDAPSELPAPTTQPIVNTPRTTKLQRGVGRCRVDEDCVLTGYREGCCAPTCEPYAINKQDLAARKAKENCDAYRSGEKACRSPTPCPPRTTHALAAKCENRTCTALLELLPD